MLHFHDVIPSGMFNQSPFEDPPLRRSEPECQEETRLAASHRVISVKKVLRYLLFLYVGVVHVGQFHLRPARYADISWVEVRGRRVAAIRAAPRMTITPPYMKALGVPKASTMTPATQGLNAPRKLAP